MTRVLSCQTKINKRCQLLVVWVLVTCLSICHSEKLSILIPPSDQRFLYEGRWIVNGTTSHGDASRADWPCSSIHFGVKISCNETLKLEDTNKKDENEINFVSGSKHKRSMSEGNYLEVAMYNLRSRMVARITKLEKSNIDKDRTYRFYDAEEQYLLGPSFSLSPPDSDIFDIPQKFQITLSNLSCSDDTKYEAETFLVSLRKLSEAEPYGGGIGNDVLKPSKVQFYGISSISDNVEVITIKPKKEASIKNTNESPSNENTSIGIHLEFVGASDTAGYCVDGNPEMSKIEVFVSGWKYGNCDYGMPGRIVEILEEKANDQSNIDYTYSVIASAGIGLIQNVDHSHEWMMGSETMMDYYSRTLMSENHSSILDIIQDLSLPKVSTLAVISLGGNDYNHQGNKVPSQEEFSNAFAKFLDEKVGLNEKNPNVRYKRALLICGMGWPQEVDQDPDNNRCRPCPFVEQAAIDWNEAHPMKDLENIFPLNLQVGYQFIPCDGTVVPNKNGTEDMGCNDHKNRHGQLEVAKFLAPRIEDEIEILLQQLEK